MSLINVLITYHIPKIDNRSLIGVGLASKRGVQLSRVAHVPDEYLRVLPAAGEDLGAVGREADVRDAAALSGQQAEAAAVRLQVQAKRLSEQDSNMVNRFDLQLTRKSLIKRQNELYSEVR